jgi:hypothetical protein
MVIYAERKIDWTSNGTHLGVCNPVSDFWYRDRWLRYGGSQLNRKMAYAIAQCFQA